MTAFAASQKPLLCVQPADGHVDQAGTPRRATQPMQAPPHVASSPARTAARGTVWSISRPMATAEAIATTMFSFSGSA